MTYSFHAEAELELEDAVIFYEGCSKGLGIAFAFEMKATIARILAHPQAWPIIRGEVRRCITHRFPYSILYSVEIGNIFILAVMHQHREPTYWHNRK